jgi:transposase
MVRAVPEEIPDEEHERVFDRVAAVDVAKESGMVCTRLPSATGTRRVSRVWQVPATVNAVSDLAGALVELGVEKVTVESTSDYWRIWFYVLEAAGLRVQLVNAREVKNVPGRPKTDKLDAVWLAKLTEKGLLRASFVPPAQIRVLRDYTRMRVDLIRDRTRYWQRLEKLLEDSLVKVSSVVSSLDTLSARDMLEALIRGQRDPQVLAGLARGKMKAKHAALVQALHGRFDDHHGELARLLLDQIDALTRQIDRLTVRMTTLLAAIPAAEPACDTSGSVVSTPAGRQVVPVAARLAEIPGLSTETAHQILAETGLDMNVFPTAGHLVSWAKLCPRTIQSGAKTTTGAAGKGNPYLKGVLGQAAAIAARSRTFLGERYRRLVKRRGKLKALVAVARSILVIIWHLLANPAARYHDLGPDYHTHRTNPDRKIRSLVQQLQALGQHVTLQPAP